MKQILAEYRTLLETIDAWFGHCMETLGPELIQCRRGCNGCCRGLFDISLLDARLLQEGFAALSPDERQRVLHRARPRLEELQRRWPAYHSPWLLNHLPEEEWSEMPEDDETPCALLGDDGFCQIYPWRPMVCRLHGLPNIDLSGESFSDEWCTLNFAGTDPLKMAQLRWPFRRIFEEEIRLMKSFSSNLCGLPVVEMDTFIPTALFIDFERTDWRTVLYAAG